MNTNGAHCFLCGSAHKNGTSHLFKGSTIRPALFKYIQQLHPGFTDDSYLCLNHLNIHRLQFIESEITKDGNAITGLESSVLKSIEENALITEDPSEIKAVTFGQRVADHIAEFGGSWTFIISFGGFLMAWILLNTIVLLKNPYDPYPYILLNLILSCLAAIQAPVIMMSQNRKESRDRKRAESDYKVNLKSEIEVRTLHEKLDYLMLHQWNQMMEVQEIQMELMQDMLKKVEKKI